MKRKACATPPPSRQVIGYLLISTQDQDLEKNKADIVAFGNERKLGPRPMSGAFREGVMSGD